MIYCFQPSLYFLQAYIYLDGNLAKSEVNRFKWSTESNSIPPLRSHTQRYILHTGFSYVYIIYTVKQMKAFYVGFPTLNFTVNRGIRPFFYRYCLIVKAAVNQTVNLPR